MHESIRTPSGDGAEVEESKPGSTDAVGGFRPGVKFK